jgi:hypothetical protein
MPKNMDQFSGTPSSKAFRQISRPDLILPAVYDLKRFKHCNRATGILEYWMKKLKEHLKNSTDASGNVII